MYKRQRNSQSRYHNVKGHETFVKIPMIAVFEDGQIEFAAINEKDIMPALNDYYGITWMPSKVYYKYDPEQINILK